MNKLIIPTIRTFLLGAVALGLFLFLPAWTPNYWQAWVSTNEVESGSPGWNMTLALLLDNYTE